MQFFVIFTPKQAFEAQGMPADFPDLERQEQAQTRVLYGDGSLRQVWALGPKGRGAAALFEARSPERLQQVIDSFPLLKADYADAKVLQLAPHPAFTPQP